MPTWRKQPQQDNNKERHWSHIKVNALIEQWALKTSSIADVDGLAAT